MYFEIWLHQQTPTRGLSEISALSALAAFEIDLEREVWTVAAPEWRQAIARATTLARSHTPRIGARSMDILHVAFATQQGVTELLTFDENQRSIAQAEGLTSNP